MRRRRPISRSRSRRSRSCWKRAGESMNRFARAALPAALLALCAPALAQGGLPPVEPETIAAAARSCADSLSEAGVDEKRLTNEGWQRASLSAKGKAVDSSLRIYARGNVVLLLTPDAVKGVVDDCYLTARIGSRETYARAMNATQAALAGKVIKTDNGSVSWILSGQKAARIDPTGSQDAPAVRISVVYV